MALTDVLEGLGGLSRGIMQGEDFNQRQKYNQLLASMAEQRLLDMQQQKAMQAGLGSTLRQYFAQQGDTGQPSPTTGQGAQPLQQLPQQQPLLPQVPPGTAQMNAPGGGLPGIVANLESGGGRDIASQPSSMVDPLYGQYAGFADQYGKGAPGVMNFAQAELRARPGATFGDYYSDYVLGTGRPGAHTISDLASTDVPGAQGAYRNLINNAGIPPSTPLASLVGGTQADPRIQLASANQTYSQMKASMPPPIAQAASAGAGTTLRSLSDQPLQLQGRLQPADLWKAVDTANPNAGDDIKAAIFTNLYPMLSQQGKLDFAEAMQVLNYRQRGDEFTQRQQQQRDEFAQRQQGIEEQRQFNRQIAEERLGQGQERLGQGQQRIDQAQQRQSQASDPATVDAVAKGIAEYRQAPLSGWTMRSPWGQAVMAKVYQDNPDYSAAQYAAGVSGARAFTSGRQADQVRSMSVAVDHLQVAEDLGKALQQPGDTRLLNQVTQEVKKQFGYEGPVNFDTAKMIVGDEVTKAIAGGTLSMTERMALQDQFSKASSPEQLTGVATTLKRLLGGQLRGLQRQYEAIPGEKPPFEQKISPQAKEQLGGATSPDYSKMSDDELLKSLDIK